MAIVIVHRKPSVAEFESVVASVGFRAHDHGAVEVALANTLFCVCAIEEQQVVGIGGIVGDGAISFLLTGVVVRPSHQRRVIGTLIVQALCNAVEALPYKNMMMEIVPQPGSRSFYERFGFRASRSEPLGMVRWFNEA